MRGRIPSRLKPEFALWMRRHLGYQATDTDVRVSDDAGRRARVVGVRGETYGIVWHRLRTIAIGACAIAVVLRNVVPVVDGDVPMVPYVLLCFAIIAYIASHLGRMRTRRYAWVECRNQSSAVSRADIVALDDAMKKVRASDAPKWIPAQLLVVAGPNGFELDALGCARSLGVESGFERLS
jgi:hypothetical protein